MRAWSMILLLLLLANPISAQKSRLRGKLDNEGIAVIDGTTTNSNSTTRILSGAHGTAFKPLDCNEDPCNAGSTTWKKQGYDPNDGMVVIPCGLCVTMDFDESDTIVLPQGLDVQGTLSFPNGYKLTLKTPFVRVQGNLEMTATKAVTDEPNVKIILTGKKSRITKFVPARNNRFACTSNPDATTPSECDVGAKAFVVAGGKVNIRGLPKDCPTWVHLEDTIREQIKPPRGDFNKLPALNPEQQNRRCRSMEPYMDEDFSSGANPHGWTGGYGAFFSVTDNGIFKVTNRKLADEQGPTWDMMHVRDCLIPGQEYLFSARIKLTKAGVARGTPTTCAKSGENCLALRSTVRTPSSGRIMSRKGFTEEAQSSRYGEWHGFYASFTYSEEELDPENIYQILYLANPEAGVDIHMDDVRFSQPPVSTVPDPINVCNGNLVLNGDAESNAVQPYPFTYRGGHLSVDKQADGNLYFHQRGRTSDSDSVVYEFTAPGCLVANGEYKVSARFRVDSDAPVQVKALLKSMFTDGSSARQTLFTCPGSTRTSWTLCESGLTIEPKLISKRLQNLRLQFETIGAPTQDMDVDDIRLEALDGPVTSIIVPDSGVSKCWGKGADILITSHTLDYDDQQVRRLISSPTPLRDGLVKLELDSAIVPPTTRRQSRDFAVEVALLSRNFVFEGETDDNNDLLGAHFMVLHTPQVRQKLEGVEFRNFGQQGVLGKYPIHFHMCDNVRGTVVSKNTIRESNQRCVVVHGTHNVTVSDNIAYNTMGHCFMAEDGGEVDNVFRGNLGALTRSADKLVGPMETDHQPSTFWCTNPNNVWLGNVAAGSEDSGFWFELQMEVRGPTADMPLSAGMNPRITPLKLFQDNVSHSNRKTGLRTYPSGFIPDETSVFINTKSYKNKQEGIFFHNSNNLVVKGGILADNMIQADFDRADDIELKQTTLIGVTDQYKEVVRSQSGVPWHSEMIVGLELHGFADKMERAGAVIRGIKFSGFDDTGSSHTALIEIDDEVRVGYFDYWSTLEGVEIADDIKIPRFNFRKASAAGISNIYLTDLDSSMRPPGSNAQGTSTVISNSATMTKFLDVSECEEYQKRSYMYCPDTCLRTITYRVSPSETEDFICRISEAGNSRKFIELTSKFYYETVENEMGGPLDENKNSSFRKRRYFSTALPPGNYVANFFNPKTGATWPTSVETTVAKPQCEDSMSTDAVQLKVTKADDETCRELIVNGDFEMSNDDYPHWLHNNNGLALARKKGMDGSNAIVDMIHSREEGSIGQFLDTRCLERGRQYEVKAWVKLEQSGKTVSCDQAQGCPRARLRIKTPMDEAGLEFDEFTVGLTSTFIRPLRESGWNLLQGVFTVDARIAQGSSVWFYVERGMKQTAMFLDNVSVSMLPQNCNELVLNGEFSGGNSTYWEKNTDNDKVKLAMVRHKGNDALKLMDRSSSTDSPTQEIRIGCFVKGSRYLATAKVRLRNGDGSQLICEASQRDGVKACPRMRLKSYVNAGLESQTTHGREEAGAAFTDHGLTSDGWHTMTGVFAATESDVLSDKSVLYFDGVHRSNDIEIDDVSITPMPLKCNDLIVNGDAEYDETPRFWRHRLNEGAKIEVVRLNRNNHAFRFFNRRRNYDGIHQFVPHMCLKKGTKWSLSARMKLVSRKTGKGVVCNPSEKYGDACPLVSLAGWSSGDRVLDDKIYMSNRPRWKKDDFNTYEAEFTVSSLLASCNRVAIGFRSYDIDWDLVVDDIRVRPSK